ncbi:unnamed protein product [Pleuronectes platessa]|uniref:Uncharacterized protein n=1 Tax=Pleuronectes platessa TaxID=8262 RepID=A0A9N7YUU4_PLEPL|nr:unnamed protein product [Pleuronectes platessa]
MRWRLLRPGVEVVVWWRAAHRASLSRASCRIAGHSAPRSLRKSATRSVGGGGERGGGGGPGAWCLVMISPSRLTESSVAEHSREERRRRQEERHRLHLAANSASPSVTSRSFPGIEGSERLLYERNAKR